MESDKFKNHTNIINVDYTINLGNDKITEKEFVVKFKQFIHNNGWEIDKQPIFRIKTLDEAKELGMISFEEYQHYKDIEENIMEKHIFE